VVVDGEREQADEARVQRDLAPVRDEAREREAARAPEQGGPVRVGLLQVERDGPGIGDRAVAVHQHRHLLLPREGEPLLLGEAAGHRVEGEPLVPEREARPPAIGAEPAVVLGAGEFVEREHRASP
jgi:hypothetical protein